MSVATEAKLIAPHGGELVDRTGERPDDLDSLETLTLASRELSDLDMLASGALSGYDAWITGIRREQSPTRANAQKVEWSERYGVWKVQPLVDWDAKRVQAYIHVNEIPYNPLHDAGYPSIGCIPCTRPVVAGEDERAGRWTGSDKLECGIHINAPLIKESND